MRRCFLLALTSSALLGLGCSSDVVVFGGAGGVGGSGSSGSGSSGSSGAGGTGGGPCVPGAETCDGLDNDCDGEVDEGCGCQQGQTQPCYSGDPDTIGVGTCAAGTQTCDAQGAWGPCQGEITPAPDACNGLDEDCDGQVDEDLGTQSCGIGACAVTVASCVNGMPQGCVPGPPGTEVCDGGADNDCDGLSDESDPNSGQFCNTGQPGPCSWGAWQCNGGALMCVPNQAPQPEACDGQDNDCDGQVDDGNPGGGNPCITGLPGACSAGTLACNGGILSCTPNQPPQGEICDGIDNNCDGQIDAEPCGCGGTATCVGGMLVCGGSMPVYFEETFAGNGAGWTLDSTWAIGPTSVSSGQVFGNPDPAFDHTPSADNGVAGVVLGGNSPAQQHPSYSLTSPIIDTSAIAGPVYLDFWRWLNSDYTPFMQNAIQVYNGTAWVTIWQSGGPPGIADAAWQHVSHDLTPYKNAAMRVRFGYNASNGVFTVSSWNVDDVRIAGAPCN